MEDLDIDMVPRFLGLGFKRLEEEEKGGGIKKGRGEGRRRERRGEEKGEGRGEGDKEEERVFRVCRIFRLKEED